MLQTHMSFVSQDIHQIINYIFNNKVQNLTDEGGTFKYKELMSFKNLLASGLKQRVSTTLTILC